VPSRLAISADRERLSLGGGRFPTDPLLQPGDVRSQLREPKIATAIVPTSAKSATIPPSGISVRELPTDSETKLGANTPVKSTASHIEAMARVAQAHFCLKIAISPSSVACLYRRTRRVGIHRWKVRVDPRRFS
jgi:hypothetical protein